MNAESKRFIGGASRDRTDDLCSAIAALSQLSYSPVQHTPLASARWLCSKAYLTCILPASRSAGKAGDTYYAPHLRVAG